MHVLVIKMSSLGDVIHTLPALTDAAQALPMIRFSWVVEEGIAEVPAWHKQVEEVIPIALRRWRKNPRQAYASGEWQAFYKRLRARHYDKIIDAQGLIKSACITRLAKGQRYGLARQSLREPLASLAYEQTFQVAKEQHAISRARELFAKALGYAIPLSLPDGGIDKARLPNSYPVDGAYLVFLHGTTWENKHWPEAYWQELAKQVVGQGFKILLPWGNRVERERAEKIAAYSAQIQVLPKLSLTALSGVLARAKAAVAVDTGLGHLAAALAVPTVGLYGPTDPVLARNFGPSQQHIAATFACAPCLKRQCQFKQESPIWPPCFTDISPARVWQQLALLL
jgi:heptosyltransferase-1